MRLKKENIGKFNFGYLPKLQLVKKEIDLFTQRTVRNQLPYVSLVKSHLVKDFKSVLPRGQDKGP